jgi:transcriptional regulator with XRE-family HTH domain
VYNRPGTIAARLRKIRADKGWVLREASAATGGILSPSRISNWEQGLKGLGVAEAGILAKAYGTTAAHLLCLDDDQPVLSKVEQEHIRNLRALPENERNGYIRRVAAVALAYKEPVTDERVPHQFSAPAKPARKTPHK